MSGVFDRHPWARWTLPGVAVAGLVAGGLFLPSTASADGLAPRTAEQLLADVQQAQVPGLSGHVTETADLGLPSLPASMTGTDTSLTSLITGTHTARVWTSGTGKSRIAIEAQGQETDVVRNGGTVWEWSSANKSATRMLLPADTAKRPATTRTPLTPQQAAQQIVQALGPSTTITTAANDVVAQHAAYELVLTPKDSSSRVASVQIAIDGKTKIPLRVEVFSTRMSAPAISFGFDRVDFTAPAASVFDFTPPAGATVTTKDLGTAAAKKPSATASGTTPQKPTVIGTGWTQIATGHIDLAAMTKQPASGSTSSGTSISRLLGLLPTVTGSYGTAHVIDGTLVSVVITTDGRYAVGAVAPDKLLAALPAK